MSPPNPTDPSLSMNPTDTSTSLASSLNNVTTISSSSSSLPSSKSNPTLPLEILLHIFRHFLTLPPRCALSLFCRDQPLCQQPDEPNKNYFAEHYSSWDEPWRRLRMDIYTLPSPDAAYGSRGKVATRFGHWNGSSDVEWVCKHGWEGSGGGFWVTPMWDPRDVDELKGMPNWLMAELLKMWARESAMVVPTVRTIELWNYTYEKGDKKGEFLFREEWALELLPWKDDVVGEDGRWMSYFDDKKVLIHGEDGGRVTTDGGDGVSEKALTYLWSHVRHLFVTSTVYDHYNFVAEEARLMAVLGLRWDALAQLETLCIDLRGYGLFQENEIDFMSPEDVMEFARVLQGKQLRLLVIAGLRSYEKSYPEPPEPLRIDEVEQAEWDEEKSVWVTSKQEGVINWWKMFEGAMRPGGRIVLVDGRWYNQEEAAAAYRLEMLERGRQR